MFSVITQILILQSAYEIILQKIGMEINSHATCIITNGNSNTVDVNLNHFPIIRSDCKMWENRFFISQMQHDVSIGCSFFIVSEACGLYFLDNFHEIHDWVEQKYKNKVLVVINTQETLTYWSVMDILRHRVVINDLPLTLMLQSNTNEECIDIWSAYPYESYFRLYNRFFLRNFTFRNHEKLIPTITNLNGLPVTAAIMNYPPYTAHHHVPPGTGNAQLYNSNESLTLNLQGQETLILVEFCLKYNCSLVARLEYDEDLWGEMYPNRTGSGLLGAVTKNDANVACGALYLWKDPYEFTQYSAAIQMASATNIVPKPLPLPYWQTPALPFPGYIWGFIICSFLISAATLFIVNISQVRIIAANNEGEYATYGFFNSIFTVYKISIFQGVNINIRFFSNVAIFTVILTYALVIGNLYAGGLSSVMTITRYEDPVDTLEKLVKSKFIWGGTTLLWVESIQRSEYPPHKKLVNGYLVKPIAELRELLPHHNMAVSVEKLQHGTLSYQSFIDEESSKNYMMMKEPLYRGYSVFMASKTWPFMEQLNRIVLMQQESGIQYYLEYLSATRTMNYDIQRNIEENGKPPPQGEPVRLSIEHVLGAILLLLFGNTVATIAFFAEVLLNYFKKKQSSLTIKSV